MNQELFVCMSLGLSARRHAHATHAHVRCHQTLRIATIYYRGSVVYTV